MQQDAIYESEWVVRTLSLLSVWSCRAACRSHRGRGLRKQKKDTDTGGTKPEQEREQEQEQEQESTTTKWAIPWSSTSRKQQPCLLLQRCSGQLPAMQPGAVREVGAVSLCLPTSEGAIDRSHAALSGAPHDFPGISGPRTTLSAAQQRARRSGIASLICGAGAEHGVCAQRGVACMGMSGQALARGRAVKRNLARGAGGLGAMFQDQLPPQRPLAAPKPRGLTPAKTAVESATNGGCTCLLVGLGARSVLRCCGAAVLQEPTPPGGRVIGTSRANERGAWQAVRGHSPAGAWPRPARTGQDHSTTQVTA
jgi:hypothetical protein